MEELQELTSMRTAIILPGIQSLLTGLFFGVAAGTVANLAGWPVVEFAGIVGSVSSLFAWVGSQARWAGLVNYAMVGVQEPEQDYNELKPEEMPLIRVELSEGTRTRIIDLPITKEQLIAFSSGVRSGTGLTVNGWVGTGRPFTRTQFENFRDVMIDRGLARWLYGGKSRGCELTPAGRAVINRLAGGV